MIRKLLAKLPKDRSGPVPMWKSFLQSMGLLAIAMISALYSTGAARNGQMIGAGVSALLALGIAAWVGIRFVPRLARSVDWDWLPIFTQYKVTRDGGVFFGALLVVLSAAINTSNNLLYMVLSALLAVLALSGVLSGVNFKFLEIEAVLPETVFAGETFPVTVRLRNRRRLFPAFSLWIEGSFLEPTTKADRTRATPITAAGVYFSCIPPKKTDVGSSDARFPKRGRHTIEKLTATSRFPFGFFSKGRKYSVAAECICYPEILPQGELDISIADILGSHERLDRGQGSDLHSIRDYVPSDSARHVHWKASAKTASLKTREFAVEDSRHVVLAFDRFGLEQDEERFEELVTRTASLAFHLIGNGADVTLASDDWESPAAGGNPENTLEEILRYLALTKMSPMSEPPSIEPQAGSLLLSLRTPSENWRAR